MGKDSNKKGKKRQGPSKIPGAGENAVRPEIRNWARELQHAIRSALNPEQIEAKIFGLEERLSGKIMLSRYDKSLTIEDMKAIEPIMKEIASNGKVPSHKEAIELAMRMDKAIQGASEKRIAGSDADTGLTNPIRDKLKAALAKSKRGNEGR